MKYWNINNDKYHYNFLMGKIFTCIVDLKGNMWYVEKNPERLF